MPVATAEHTLRQFQTAGLAETDPAIAALIDSELGRQRDQLELIASENFTWPAVLEAVGSVLTNKYAEGYPGHRYYGGCEWVDEVEQLAIDRARELFGADHANVQPHAGGPANMAAYFALIEPGDAILGLRLDHGGHLTHGLKVNFSGRLYDVHPYGVRREDSLIDFDEVRRLAHEVRPKLIVAGASAYPRIIDAARFREIADEVGAMVMVDMAHFAGLVAAGLHPNPVEHADVVTSTTHKTLAGPRAGLVLSRAEHANAVDRAVFPGLQGGPLCHVVAAKAVCFKIAQSEGFRDYQRQVVTNAATLGPDADGRRPAAAHRRHRQPPAAARPAHHAVVGQGRRGATARGRDHGQPKHRSLRRAPAHDRVRRPHRHPGRNHARPGRGRHARGGGDHPGHAGSGRRPEGAARADAGADGLAVAVPGLRARVLDHLVPLTIVDHPLVQHKLGLLRDRETTTRDFRLLAGELAAFLCYEATRGLELEPTEVQTPLEVAPAHRVSGKKLGVVAVLRAGVGMLDAVLDLIPVARVGFVGLYRDEQTLMPVEYYCKLPGDLAERDVIVLDPMLATGGSASAAIRLCKEQGARRVTMVALVAVPVGVARLEADHPDVEVVVAALDRELNDQGFILPGLGDAGDRLYGTR